MSRSTAVRLSSPIPQTCIGFFSIVAMLVLVFVFSYQTAPAQETFESKAQAAVGLLVKDIPARSGAKVVQVAENSSASKAGIKPGNIIVKVNKNVISCARDFNRAIAGYDPGTFVDIGVIQDNTKVTRGIQIMPLPGTTESEKTGNSPGNEPDLTIASLTLSSKKMEPESIFDISLALFASNPPQKSDTVDVFMTYTVTKKEEALLALGPEKLALPNGLPSTIARRCKAHKQKGRYKITIKLEMAGKTAEKSVFYQVE